LKDILPPEIKEPREPQPFAEIEDGWKDKMTRERTYEPAIVFPDWPGNDEANKKLEETGVFKPIEEEKASDSQYMEELLFKDSFEYYMPSSIRDMTGDNILWLRPKEYLLELAIETELKRVKAENRTMVKKIKAQKKNIKTSNMSVLSYNSDKEVD
jgi:hypothetical protein